VHIKEIARRTGISRKTVKKYLRKLEEESGPGDSEGITDKKLAPLGYNIDNTVVRNKRQEALLRHFEQVKNELHKTGVTKQLLWVEYNQDLPDGYQYSQ
jgi:DNA-binding Lrp family transcriptional regulator